MFHARETLPKSKVPLGSDIICKLIVDKGVGFIMQTRTDEGHYMSDYTTP